MYVYILIKLKIISVCVYLRVLGVYIFICLNARVYIYLLCLHTKKPRVVRAIGNLSTSEDPNLQDPKITPVDGSDLTRTFPRMRTLHDTRRDWFSDEEL